MKTTKILEEQIAPLKIASLPSRPNADTKYGGYAYSAEEMKAAFDKLPLFIVEKFNSLIGDITASEDGIAGSIKTGIKEEHTLATLFSDIENGALASYLIILGKSLSEHIASINSRLEALEEACGL